MGFRAERMRLNEKNGILFLTDADETGIKGLGI